MPSENADLDLKAIATYIDGKMKRYNLMFAVNGGTFALAKIFSESKYSLGKLNLTHMAIGAVAFTFLMWFDIWLWGESIRIGHFEGRRVFQAPGKAILSLLASLLILGWLFALYDWPTIVIVFSSLAICGAVLVYYTGKEAWRKAKEEARKKASDTTSSKSHG